MRTRKWILSLAAAALLLPAAAGAQSPEQKAMAQQIASQIRESGQLTNYRVGVKYQDGVAWLLGSVTDKSQEAKAVAIASKLEGVDHVISKLEVGASNPVAKKVQPAVKTVAGQESSSGVLLKLFDDSKEDDKPAPKTTAKKTMPAAKPANYEPKPLQAPASTRMAQRQRPGRGMPRPFARTAPVQQAAAQRNVQPAQYGAPGYMPAGNMGGAQGVSYDSPNMPGYAWPSYASHPNYSAVTYPKQYSPTAWPYIGPFYPYPQVPLGWRKVALEWDDGWWFLDFSHHQRH